MRSFLANWSIALRKIFREDALRLAIAFGSGVSMGLTTAPLQWWWLGWLAFVPLWYLVNSSSRRGKKRYGFAWGIGYHGYALSWILGIHPLDWMGIPWLPSLAIATFCWIFITLWGAAVAIVWVGILCWLNSRKQLAGWRRSLLGTALWCALEKLWSQGDLWWTSLSFTQSPHNIPILHLGQLSGATAVTATIVFFNGLVGEGIIAWQEERTSYSQSRRHSPQRYRYFIAAGLFLLSTHGVGWYLAGSPIERSSAMAINIGIVQGNIPNRIKLYREGWMKALEGYARGYNILADAGVDAVLTPEAALPFLTSEIKNSSFYQAILDRRVTTWLGGFGETGRDYTQSIFNIDSSGKLTNQYNKHKLVPLGEYIPFKLILGKLVNRLSPIQSDMVKGAAIQKFTTPFGAAIVGICYESAFGEHFRQQAPWGEFVLVASNNAHYAANMPTQHHAQNIMRAIEVDRWLVSAANTGYSAFITPHGETLWRSPLNEFSTHSATIYRRQTQTPYSRYGDWLWGMLSFVAVGGVISARDR
jgi:apolipoprotein N-acyltransferase